MLATKTSSSPCLKPESVQPRCKDCDSDCWEVPNKLSCWLGGVDRSGEYYTDPAEGFCPWLMDGIPFPSKE